MRDSKPFFTIVTPTLNSEKYLVECIKSVESQSFKDLEHIFIDSYSTDKTMKILKEYKKRNPKRVFIYQYPKAGISDAFNKGIKHSNGKYLNFLGSDDLLETGALQVVYDNMKDERYSWCYGNTKIIDSEGKVRKIKKFSHFNYFGLLFFYYLNHQSIFMNRLVFLREGFFNVQLKFAMDHEYLLRIGYKYKPKQITSILSNFRKTSSSVTLKLWKSQLNEKLNICLHYSPSRLYLFVFLSNRIVYLKKILGLVY